MKPTPTNQKLRGGYYTPKSIADFLARWAIRSADDKVLEPSCGDGVLLEAAVETLIKLGAENEKAISLVHGVEFDPQEAAKASERISVLSQTLPPTEIHVGDFFSYCKDHLANKRLFDVVIGNPPFIRYQNFPEQHRAVAFYLMKMAGLHPNRLTNAWVPFLVASTLLLNRHGRLAMVIPAELLQVNYAAELRYFLSTHYSSLTLITFRKLVFEGIQQEVVLLLGERDGSEHTGIRVMEVNGMNDLVSISPATLPNVALKEMDHSTEKWTMYFLEEEELQLLRKLKSDTRLTTSGHVIDVDVGIVTGLNQFFVLTEEQINDLSLAPYTQPVVGRSTYLQGLLFSRDDWVESKKKQAAAFLFTSPDVPYEHLAEEVKKYVRGGEEQKINEGYKCRIRKRWYVVPSVWTPDAFMLRQVHNYPKIVVNAAAATCTDTIHRVRLRNGANIQTVAAAFLNSLTFAFSEIIGRSYGGGVLELEPNEAEKLPLPLSGAEQLDLDEIDNLLRKGDIYAVLNHTDDALLRQGLGLAGAEISLLRGIWEKLRDRRINRRYERSER